MAATKKITRKEIKQPDEFLTLSARAIEFARKHTREIIIGVACALVAGLLAWAGSAYVNKRDARAARMLGQALALLHPTANEAEAEQPVAAEAKRDAEAENKALALLQELADNYKRTEASGVAQILLGQHYYEGGDYDAAIGEYDGFLKKARKPELTAMAREGLAYSYEAKGDYAQALKFYEKLSRMSLANVQGWGYLGMARCYEKLGELQQAVDTYRTFLAEDPQHPKAAEAQASIARITQALGTEKSEKSEVPAEKKAGQSPQSADPE